MSAEKRSMCDDESGDDKKDVNTDSSEVLKIARREN